MGKAKAKDKELTLNDLLKIEAAKEIGVFDKVKHMGWDKLTSQETGKIGAIVKKKLRSLKNNELKQL